MPSHTQTTQPTAIKAATPLSKRQVIQPKNKRPVIRYVESELPRIVDEACEAIVKAGELIFARGTSLVRPVHIPIPEDVKSTLRAAGDVLLVPLDKTALVEILTALIDWWKPVSGGERWKQISCPAMVAETIISRRGDRWPFPQLQAVISAPTLRRDGTLLDLTGFDHATGILFASHVHWPKIADTPSCDDAQEALTELRDLISGFPFVTDVDRSAAIAMILTSLVRPSLPSAPLFGVSAPTPGTGKSKLVDVVAILSTGRPAAVTAAPSDEAELQKHIGAMLMEGEAFVTLDNIEYPLRSAFLCQVLTQATVAVRVLGESKSLKLPTNVTLCATGNSLRFAGDLTRRIVLIELDAHMERPEERVFQNDVIALAASNRTRYVTAALTILRAFVIHAGPKLIPALGSFETWSDFVRSAIVWLGEADPLANTFKVREGDPEREATSIILNALPVNESWTVSDIARKIEQDFRDFQPEFRRHERLAEALSEFIERGILNRRRFGKYLNKHAGRIVDGRCIVRRGKDRTNVALWAVEAT